jgi:periplasmic copper chaperone A
MRHILTAIAYCAATSLPIMSQAQTTVDNPWVRGTAAQQRATAMYAHITSKSGGKIVGVASPVAGVVEVHEMTMEGTVMKMRPVPSLELPAGKLVPLQPGGLHVMLMELRQPLREGDAVPVTFTIEGKDGKRETIEVKAAVRSLGGRPGGNETHDHKHDHKH